MISFEFNHLKLSFTCSRDFIVHQGSPISYLMRVTDSSWITLYLLLLLIHHKVSIHRNEVYVRLGILLLLLLS